MSDIAAISGVESRIAAIRTRIGTISGQPVRSADPLAHDLTPDIGEPADPRAGFDPFGSVYQSALVAAGIGIAGSDTPSDTGLAGDAAAIGSSTGFTSAAALGTSLGVETIGSPSAYSSYASYSSYSSYSSSSSTGLAGATGASSVLDGAVRVGYGGTSMIATGSGWVPLSGGGVNASGQSVGQIGGYGAMPVPAELAAYGNGRIPPDALQSIGQGGHRLYAPAAQQWQRMVDAAAADGVTMRVTDSYRSYDQQVELAERKGLYRDGGYAATPGTSNHGWGLALDLDTDQRGALAWMKQHGHEFGFVEAVPREPWHWEYRPTQA